jgi:hypothetical protein
MGAEEPGRNGDKALPLIRVRSRATAAPRGNDAAGAASTPSLGTPVTVPFLWEDAPGRPKHLPPLADYSRTALRPPRPRIAAKATTHGRNSCR